jgi:DNA topoisomerase-1
MTKLLLIVESPNKCKSVQKYIPNSICVASCGHIYDLGKEQMNVDENDNFKPNYSIMPDKKKVVVNLLYHKSKCDEVIICSDCDREGDMIGWSIKEALNLVNPKRLIFTSITQSALTSALANPTTLNMDSVFSAQSRRILDRLLGYKLSPLLMKYLKSGVSAGRVQSVCTRIIIDNDDKVKESIQDVITKPFYKSLSNFKINNQDIIINTVLMKDKEIYKIETKEQAVEILNKLNKNIVCKIIDITENELKRSPPPPHITSSLLQEVSTKFGMGAKECMQIAQSLYEQSFITYMRSDSPSISPEGIGMIKKYVNENYGENYYQFRPYKSKDANAQEGHECIRPTKIDVDTLEGEKITAKMQKVYSVIWKRAVASLMASAIFDVQNINIDLLDKKNSILPKDTFYNATYENMKFDGYLAVYKKEKIIDSDIENKDDKKEGKLDIKLDTKIEHLDTDMNELYASPLMHYNEAGLIKYLKNESIGRPSTYASIISKILERNYVEIINIEGIEKSVLYMNVSAKKYGTIKEKTKNIKIGGEKNKIIPTSLGRQVNAFLMEHFEKIMDIKFTAGMEEKLDLIAHGKVKWYNVIREYYETFNPIVIKLSNEAPQKSLTDAYSANDKNLGEYKGQLIYLTKSKFGWCVKVMENEKWRYGNIGDMDPKDVTLEDAIGFLQYPRDVGKIGSSNVSLNKGKFGFYFKIASKLVGLKDKEYDPTDKTDEELLELAKEICNEGSSDSLPNNTYMIGKTKVFLKDGDNGKYLMIPHGNSGARKPTFISIPKGVDQTKLTATKIKEIMDNHNTQAKQANKWKKN